MFRSLQSVFLFSLMSSALFVAGCGAGGPGTIQNTYKASEAPVITTAPAQNGAQIVTLTTTTKGASIYYTLDGSTPTAGSPVYEAPFLVASNVTLKAMTWGGGNAASSVVSQSFSPNIPSGTLVWSDEFKNTTGSNAQPDPTVWDYDTGSVNSGVQDYCAWNSSSAPCDPASPNTFVGTDGYLHIVVREPSAGVYTSGRLKSQRLFSFQYGRIEARIKVPEQQGMWPAFWLLGNNYATVNWPACGEMDVMERVNSASTPDWNQGSIHGTGFINANLGTVYNFPSGQTASGWHTYGMIWNKGSVSYYVDDPNSPYVTYTPSSLNVLSGTIWPFDAGPNFIILNVAVGGAWAGNPDATSAFPTQMLVDYVRVYTN